MNDENKALLIAVEAGDAAATATALRRGADVNARAGDSTALMLASLRGSLDVITVLLDAGADVELRDGLTNTALILAAIGSSRDAIKLLLDGGADPNNADQRKKSPLMWVVDGQFQSRDTSSFVTLLIDRGADVNAQDDAGRTALVWASTGISLGTVRAPVLKALVDGGVAVDCPDVNGETAMFALVRYIDFVLAINRAPSLIKVLTDAGADRNVRNNNGQTPLGVVDPRNPLVIELLEGLGFTL